jgi:hypothetical protein
MLILMLDKLSDGARINSCQYKSRGEGMQVAMPDAVLEFRLWPVSLKVLPINCSIDSALRAGMRDAIAAQYI